MLISNVERQLNRMNILVINTRGTRRTRNNNNNYINNNINENNNNIIQSPEIICPIYKESFNFEIHNYKISLYGCKQGHKQDNMKLDEFMNSKKFCGCCQCNTNEFMSIL